MLLPGGPPGQAGRWSKKIGFEPESQKNWCLFRRGPKQIICLAWSKQKLVYVQRGSTHKRLVFGEVLKQKQFVSTNADLFGKVNNK